MTQSMMRKRRRRKFLDPMMMNKKIQKITAKVILISGHKCQNDTHSQYIYVL